MLTLKNIIPKKVTSFISFYYINWDDIHKVNVWWAVDAISFSDYYHAPTAYIKRDEVDWKYYATHVLPKYW